MITAKNYAAQAEKGLHEYMLNHDMKGDDVFIKQKFLNNIKEAVHFSMQDNGCIFDDSKKGIKGESIRLPFPKITLEYYVHKNDKNASNYSSKRLIYAEEVTGDRINKAEDEIWIIVYSAAYYEEEKIWFPDIFGWSLPSEWDTYYKKTPIFDQKVMDLTEGGKEFLEVSGFPIKLCPNLIDSIDSDFKDAIFDTGNEVNALLEFCEALSCSNVKHEIMETINPAVNQRRIRDGKVPMYETRTLWIDVPGESKGSGEWQGGTHRSLRQHLRRGHIRKLQSGKNIWVNAAVVGAKENGFIKKNYAIKEPA
jgi:hypothetical protein